MTEKPKCCRQDPLTTNAKLNTLGIEHGTESCSPSLTVLCRSGGWNSRSAMRGTR